VIVAAIGKLETQPVFLLLINENAGWVFSYPNKDSEVAASALKISRSPA